MVTCLTYHFFPCASIISCTHSFLFEQTSFFHNFDVLASRLDTTSLHDPAQAIASQGALPCHSASVRLLQTGAAGTNLAISKSVTSCIPILMKPHYTKISRENRKWLKENTNLYVGANVIAPGTLMTVIAIPSATFHPATAGNPSGNIA